MNVLFGSILLSWLKWKLSIFSTAGVPSLNWALLSHPAFAVRQFLIIFSCSSFEDNVVNVALSIAFLTSSARAVSLRVRLFLSVISPVILRLFLRVSSVMKKLCSVL